ncbi:aspartate kinase [Zhaonella formicivorans]|uniref:aspartate kinase n=1 Tax=Zhaonella formicivorans TaxID=2528593 RepID=UPI0010ECE4A7|nr:aspartate kinase [Zhaonella formicivorans]
MRILVQKYGGSSVATEEARQQVAAKIIAAKQEGYSLVVVVSAIGRQGAPYATDTLISLATKSNPELSQRELDLVMSCGEIISGVILAGTLQGMGYKSVCFTGAQAGIITDNQYGDARVVKIDTKRIVNALKDDYIVIVTGFQGVTADGEITTLGRGGSDTTASALGVALDAEAIEIYTDVDGVKTADPRIVAEAKTLTQVTYNEICHLAYEGAKVIHPRAVEIAAQKNIPLKVKCTFNEAPGTLVTNARHTLEQDPPLLNDRPVTGITQITNITQIKVILTGADGMQSAAKVFRSLADAGISVDFINVHPKELIFTVKESVAAKAQNILTKLGFNVELRPGCAKVSVVGAGMTGLPGVMASIVEALAEEKIEILQSADSYTTIWCLVEQKSMEKAVRALHNKFKLNE